MPFDMSKTRLALVIAVVALFPLTTIHLGWDYWQLVTRGVEAPAFVTKVERRKSNRGIFTYYYATYTFTDAAGQRRIGRQEISADLYEVLAASKPDRDTTIRFVRTKPEINALTLARLRRNLMLWGSVGFVALGMLLLFVLNWRRERREMQSGIVAAVRRSLLLDNARRAAAGIKSSTRPTWLDQFKRRARK